MKRTCLDKAPVTGYTDESLMGRVGYESLMGRVGYESLMGRVGYESANVRAKSVVQNFSAWISSRREILHGRTTSVS